MIKKLFDILAIICGILAFVFAMALDSPTMIPTYICLACSSYLLIYVYAKGGIEYVDR